MVADGGTSCIRRRRSYILDARWWVSSMILPINMLRRLVVVVVVVVVWGRGGEFLHVGPDMSLELANVVCI